MSEATIYSFNTGARVNTEAELENENEISRFAHLLYEECEAQAYEDAQNMKRQNLGVNTTLMAAELTREYIDAILADKFAQAVYEKNQASRMLVEKLAEEAGYKAQPMTTPTLALVK